MTLDELIEALNIIRVERKSGNIPVVLFENDGQRPRLVEIEQAFASSERYWFSGGAGGGNHLAIYLTT